MADFLYHPSQSLNPYYPSPPQSYTLSSAYNTFHQPPFHYYPSPQSYTFSSSSNTFHQPPFHYSHLLPPAAGPPTSMMCLSSSQPFSYYPQHHLQLEQQQYQHPPSIPQHVNKVTHQVFDKMPVSKLQEEDNKKNGHQVYEKIPDSKHKGDNVDFESTNDVEKLKTVNRLICEANNVNLPCPMESIHSMADALKALDIVEGIDEYMNQYESTRDLSPTSIARNKPSATYTAARITRRKTTKEENQSLELATRSCLVISKSLSEELEQENKNNMLQNAPVPQTRRRAAATSVSMKLDDSDYNPEDNVNKTPAARSTRRGQAAASYKKYESVLRVYSTRRSVRFLEESMADLSLKIKDSLIVPKKKNEDAQKEDSPAGSKLQAISDDNLEENKYDIVGTKSGVLEIIDIGSATKVEKVEAHGGTIWLIAPIPNENGFVTVSADHEVKFWKYQVKQKPSQATKQLTVSNVKSMKMNDDILVVVISPDGKHIAVALLDSTVKVFYMDSLKLYLSLYGHKLPVMCIDISSDGELIVTGSQDKNLNIWGLDFGHHAEIWCLAVSNQGDFLVTGSHDRPMRRWDRSEELFFLEEEKKKRLEELFESEIDNAADDRHGPMEEIPEEGVTTLAGRKTIETLSATDSIIEALDLAEDEKNHYATYEEEKTKGSVPEYLPNVVMLGLSPSDFILRAISNVKTNDLEQTLLALPFSDALKLLYYMKDWSLIPGKVEMVCRISTILLQTHHNQLVTTLSSTPVLVVLRDILYSKFKACKDTIGFNLAAMDPPKNVLYCGTLKALQKPQHNSSCIIENKAGKAVDKAGKTYEDLFEKIISGLSGSCKSGPPHVDTSTFMFLMLEEILLSSKQTKLHDDVLRIMCMHLDLMLPLPRLRMISVIYHVLGVLPSYQAVAIIEKYAVKKVFDIAEKEALLKEIEDLKSKLQIPATMSTNELRSSLLARWFQLRRKNAEKDIEEERLSRCTEMKNEWILLSDKLRVEIETQCTRAEEADATNDKWAGYGHDFGIDYLGIFKALSHINLLQRC